MIYAILNISDSDKHRAVSIDEYTKRLGKSVSIDIVKPVKNGTQNQIIEQETKTILEILEKKYQNRDKILLSKSGEQYSTEELGIFLNKLGNHKTVFIIGGPYGLDENLFIKKGIKKISFGKITLPHGLAKLTLLEQIYRLGTIENGKKYHY